MPFTRRRVWAPEQPAGSYQPSVFFVWQMPDVGGFDIQLAADSGRATLAAQIEWNDFPQFIQDVLGFARIYSVTVPNPPGPDKTVRVIGRQVPLAFPWLLDENGEPFLYAQSIARTEGVGPLGADPLTRLPRYELIRVWITFATLNFRIYEDYNALMLDDASPTLGNEPDEATMQRYIVRGSDPFDRAVSIPTGLLRRVYESGDYKPGATAGAYVPTTADEPGPYIGEAASRIEPALDVTRIHKCLPEVPLNTILRTLGKVNSITFEGYPPETLVCIAPKIRPYISPLGRVIFDIEYRFRHYARQRKTPGPTTLTVGHNHLLTRVLRSSTGSAVLDFRRHTIGGLSSGPGIYDAADFYDLFRPDQP